MTTTYTNELKAKLNEDIAQFKQVFPVTDDMKMAFSGVSRLIMLDRYTFKDTEKKTLKVGDFVVLTVKTDPKFPARGYGYITAIDWTERKASVKLDESFVGVLEDAEELATGIVTRPLDIIDKPLEIYYEQIAKRNARGLAAVETDEAKREQAFNDFYEILSSLDFVPGGRVIYGAGSETDVTYFNCFAGDTIVQTAYYGPQKIKDLKGEYEVYSMDGIIRKAEFKSFGIQELYEVEFANGEKIKTTAGHEWYTYDRKKSNYIKVTTLELEGQKIPVVGQHLRLGDSEEYKKGIQHGVVYGDGTLENGSHTMVLLHGEKEQLAEFFGNYTVTPHYNGDYVGVYGLPKHFKELPSESESNDYWYGFVVGLIATDGSCDERGSVMIHQSSKEDLQCIADNLYRTPFVHSDIRMTRELNPYNGDYSPCYALQLIKSTIAASDLIKQSHYEKFTSSPLARRTNIDVISVKPLGYNEEVFCCEEPETHSFVIGTGYLTSNCYVMPYPQDSREGIGEHRNKVMEIMSRGGGVGTNGSTLRPKNAIAKGVNGKSSGSVSWLDDIAKLTHLVEQGGSRRGAQMIMLADWHPDILDFIISKMQNPRILRFLVENTNDEEIRRLAQAKLKFTPLTPDEKAVYETSAMHLPDGPARKQAQQKLADGGTYSINNPEFLTGANISVAITKEFMDAVENGTEYEMRFPDIENYSEYDKALYNDNWHEYGDVREWEALGFGIKTYRTIKAKELWNLINICATYSAEPGIFFIDNANEMTNAVSYGQKVVATNPCGEQPLAPYSVCNLAAVNLANMANKETKEVDYDRLKRVVEIGTRFMDNVINATPYFMEENTKQALGERRLGMGVMGLHDLLIYCEAEYGSERGNGIVDKVFEVMATTGYRASIELAKEKGPFPFLNNLENGRELFINSGYMKKMPEDIRQGVLEHGIRNSHLLTVAPTGSTGSMVGCSTGLEPYFSFSYFRSGRLGKFMEVNAEIVQEYLDANPGVDKSNLPHWFISAMELSPEAHVDVQCIIQRWIDSSLSKTVNAPKGYAVEQVEAVYERLYRGGAKGGTVYVDGSRDSQVLSLKAEENTFEDTEVESPKVVLVDTINEIRSTDVTYGNEVGETCPVCRKGEIIDAGGCNTCSNCGAQLKCGL
ncbi:vitamin B12-dependent ribonucleotide reductase [Neobacillus niacini]|uniref:vitamin B12-dependent ribonucleotide reductase n=1 Tax=Neobacillus niacini TaxID=86668 RepID=UPI00285AF285|nr:vitamin B12-dependent ribonucleotide reductase [Neobacillus niacini]MDR7001599.1 adenosylcobalamin-dependent ribonucleoside-diphosphate reductase [Neobacillus niacini]